MLDDVSLKSLIEESIPLNKYLGVKLDAFDRESAQVVTRLELRPEYLGNVLRKMPHGGIISFLIDTTGGAAAALSLNDLAYALRLATIDMRVDYLKPARGKVLITTARVMRSGWRVIAVRSEVHDDQGTLLALGSNVFNVSR